MSGTHEQQAYPHPHVNEAWLGRIARGHSRTRNCRSSMRTTICGSATDVYLLDELRADLASGHNVRATVFIQCGFAYRTDGPPELRPVGETEYVAAVARDRPKRPACAPAPASSATATSAWASRSTRCWRRTSTPGAAASRASARAPAGMPAIVMTTATPAPQHLLMDPAFRVGLGRLRRFGLSYECSLYHPQLPELIDLARAFPDQPICANHCGGSIGIGPYRARPGPRHSPTGGVICASWRSAPTWC